MQAPALPAGHRQPRRPVHRAGGELHAGAGGAVRGVAAHAGERDGRGPPGRHVDHQPVGHGRRHRQDRPREDPARHRPPRHPPRQPLGQQRPAQPARDAAGHRHGHALGEDVRRPRQPPRRLPVGVLGAEPRRPDQQPRHRAHRHRPPRERQRRDLHAHRLGEVQRHRRPQLADHPGDRDRHPAPHQHVEHHGQQRGAAARPQPHRHQRAARRQRDQQRLVDEPELRHPEVVLGLEHRQPDQQPAAEHAAPRVPDPAGRLRGAAAGAAALPLQDHHRHQRQPGPADQHQVRRAPQRHVLPEDAVPHIVEGEAQQRVEPGAGQQHAAGGRVPVPGDPHRRGAGPLALGQHHGQHPGGEDAEQPDQDRVVRDVGQRALVAAVRDVQGDVPVHAEQRHQQRHHRHLQRQRGPAGHAAAGAALGQPRQPRQGGDAAGAVPPPEDQQERRQGGGAGGGDDDLVERGAARRFRRRRGGQPQRRSRRSRARHVLHHRCSLAARIGTDGGDTPFRCGVCHLRMCHCLVSQSVVWDTGTEGAP